MPSLPPFTVETLRRSLADVAAKANPEMIQRLRDQATEILNELPATAAGAAASAVDSVMTASAPARHTVRRWIDSHTAGSAAVFNATGVLLGDDGYTGSPISEDVLVAGAEFADRSRIPGPGFARRADAILSSIDAPGWSPGDNEMLVWSSMAAAVGMTAAMTEIEPTLHRSQSMRIPVCGSKRPSDGSSADTRPQPMHHWMRAMGLAYRETGSVDGVQSDDFAGGDVTVWVSMGQPATQAPQIPDGHRIDVLPAATLRPIDGADFEPASASVTTSFASGASAVVFDPSVLMGGPPCGVVIGPKAMIAKLKGHPMYALLAADPATIAMAWAAMATEPEHQPQTAARLCTVNVDNLRTRAERMMVRLGVHPDLGDMRVTDDDARICLGDGPRIPSRQCAIQTADAENLRRKFAEGDSGLRLMGRDGELRIDFRWLHPSADDAVARIILGERQS